MSWYLVKSRDNFTLRLPSPATFLPWEIRLCSYGEVRLDTKMLHIARYETMSVGIMKSDG
jgi:hypothetical protein